MVKLELWKADEQIIFSIENTFYYLYTGNLEFLYFYFKVQNVV